jgi:hypothetical protein
VLSILGNRQRSYFTQGTFIKLGVLSNDGETEIHRC